MKKHFRFLSLVALLTATALTSCQKEEWEMDSPFESESELDDDGTRASYKVDETVHCCPLKVVDGFKS